MPESGKPRPLQGIVLLSRGRYATILLGDGSRVEAFRPSEIFVVVGDEVSIEPRDGVLRIVEVAERRTHLSRPDPHDPRMRRLIAANIDAVIHVSSVKQPTLRLGLIDRFLVAIRHGGAEPILVLNKADLLTETEREIVAEAIDPYTRLGVPLLFCSTKTREGLEDLLALLRGKLCAFVGHSGVGKSSLLNALEPQAAARVGDVQERGGRGRHTTTLATMYDLGNATRVIDTPGIREMGLWDVDRNELRFYFSEFEKFASGCKFSDCTHTHEPSCAVKDAVERDEISAERYDAYEKLLGG